MYRDDPVGFAKEVLGVTLTEEQQDILLAVRDHRRVAVKGGVKTGKTMAAAVAALWFYATRDDALVVLIMPVADQVKRVIWREISMQFQEARVPLGGKLNKQPASGLVTGIAMDARKIVGYGSRCRDASARVSRENLLYVLDEACGIHDDTEDAVKRNLGNSGKELMLGLPTKNVGFFYDVFRENSPHTDHRDGVWRRTLPCECSPNVRAGRIVVPGMAVSEWVEEIRRECGETSNMFRQRVLGQFTE